MAPQGSDAGIIASYWERTRAPRYSLVFALPLLLAYEALAASLAGESGAGLRNAADVALKTPFLIFSGPRGSLAFFATVIAISIFFVARDLTKTRDRLNPRFFMLMLAESAVLAVLLGIVVSGLTQRLLSSLSIVAPDLAATALAMPTAAQESATTDLASMSLRTRLMLALGAGLYEELLFRVLLVGGLAIGLRWLLGKKSLLAGAIAATAGALIFSAFHYIGEYGDAFEIASFTYRAIAGLVFSGLYLTRGFGITAWTHALYDVYVMVL